MPVSICPTIDAEDAETYNQQVASIANFATRLHIDVADGRFTPNKLVDIDQVWWPGGVRADLHVMYKQPFEHIDTFVALDPQMVIVHAEAEGDFITFANTMHRHGIEVGVAVLQETPIGEVLTAADYIDHILIFSGTLGNFGGMADMGLLEKAKAIRYHTRRIEIGWDGGVNADNAKLLIEGGVQVLNVGGYIQKADDPQAAYATLEAVAETA